MSTKIRTYSELIQYQTFLDRYRYLKLGGKVGEETFGIDRYLNQQFYKSKEWRKVRDIVIVRDGACDLGLPDREISCKIIIHHMNPITKYDILNQTDFLLNPEYLICTLKTTHDAIHYGDESLLLDCLIGRSPGDTCPWKRR
jgi:hypothetical protein